MANQGCPNQDQHSQELRAENAENQKLRTKLRAMEAQVLEMAMLMLTLKSNGTNENATAVAARANLENSPSETSELVQITFAENNEGTEVHHVYLPDPVATPGIPSSSSSPAAISPQIQGLILENITHLRDPHVNPALVSAIRPHYGVSGLLRNYLAATPQVRGKDKLLKERLRIIERSLETRDPSPVPSALLSPTFKVPDFDKFEGMTCPVRHAAMYCELMFPLTGDYKLLTYCFRESLAREALSWYMQEHAHTSCWGMLVNAFLERFNYNAGKAPNRAHLRNMAQRNKETFREYAWRWRHLAAQIVPPLLEKEMIDIFMNTLPPLYYDRLIGSALSDFKSLVLAGESLENGANKEKTAYSSTETTPITRSGNVSYSSKILSQIPHSSTQARKSQKTPNYPEKKPEPFDPIPMSYSNLFDHLTSHHIISPRPIRPIQPPFPEGYDPDAMCKFHAGAVGHSVEDCKALKHVVQDLIDSKRLNFNGNNVSDFPANQSKEANVRMGKKGSPQCDPIPMSYTDLCSYLISHEWVTPRKMKPVQPPFPRGYNPKATCKFHLGAIGHSAENCHALKHLVQSLIDTNQLTFEKGERSSSQGLWTIKQE